jgi:hypothetical protein
MVANTGATLLGLRVGISSSMLMIRLFLFNLVLLFAASNVRGQSPVPSAPPKPSATLSPVPAASPAKPPPPSATPAPSATPSSEQLINSLSSADLQAAISLLKANFTKPDAINETELSRATLQGLMVRLGHGLMVLPDKPNSVQEPVAPFYGEIFESHIGYLRLGSLTTSNLQAVDKKLAEFAGKKVDALIIDLRSSAANDFAVSADFAKRFSPKGKPLFTLHKSGKPDRVFNSDRDPAYAGLLLLLADGDTAGGAEAVASALRYHDKALVIGQATAGRAVEYSDLPLPSGKILRVAVAEAVAPDGQSLYPQGVKPDLPVEMSLVDKRQIFQVSMEKGLGPFVYENERPHLNEAALIAGTNPELESVEQRRTRALERLPRDAVLQRALDLVTSLEIYQKR